ncbi:MAG: hypothetical protein WC495_06865 [Patescibacteria group bacterium]|jgi:hypothetical protein
MNCARCGQSDETQMVMWQEIRSEKWQRIMDKLCNYCIWELRHNKNYKNIRIVKKETKEILIREIDKLWTGLCKTHKKTEREKFISRVLRIVERPYTLTVSFLVELRNDLKKEITKC